jgi:hypothetical protein
LDPTLENLYKDQLDAIDAHLDLFAEFGRIERRSAAQSEKDATESGFNAGFQGANTFFESRDRGSSGGQAVAAGLLVGMGNYLWDQYNKTKEQDGLRKEALDSASQAFKERLSPTIAREQNALATFKYTASEDPFDLASRAYTFSQDQQRMPSEMMKAAEQCLAATRRVPSGNIYDPYRAYFLELAADTASRANSKELANQSWSEAYSQTAAYTARIWEEYLKYTDDASGEGRERMAWALWSSGNLTQALNQANSVAQLRGNTQRFAYNFAALLSSTDDTENSFKWFEHAVRNLGFNSIVGAKSDSDLKRMRSAEKKKFKELTMVKCVWDISDYGWVFGDDIALTNNSAFALTHVTLKCTLKTVDGDSTRELKVDQIAPQSYCIWKNAFPAIGRDKIVEKSATVTSDQDLNR